MTKKKEMQNRTDVSEQNFSVFKDCLTSQVLVLLSSDQTDSEDLDEFSLYIAQESWRTLPSSIRELVYDDTAAPIVEDVDLDISPSVTDTLAAYSLIGSPESEGVQAFLRPILESYINRVMEPPPVWSSTRTSECEICQRVVPLTYHHLIPRSTHHRVLKRGWHPPEVLNSVAWLCRPCHSAVHYVSSNEELAKEYYTLDRLLERPDIQRWAKYASKQRWGVRR